MASVYNQRKAMWAITKASIRAMFRSPSAVVFSLAFPLVFILVFGFIGGNGDTVRIGVDKNSDTASLVYKNLASAPHIRLITDQAQPDMETALRKGSMTAILRIDTGGTATAPAYKVHVKTSTATNADSKALLLNALQTGINAANDKVYPRPTVAEVIPETVPGRIYKPIDFILPGQLGFSLLSAAVFGTAFLFFSLRQTLVLKRFFATPIHRMYIILGEALSRLLFQSFGSIIIIGLGYFAFGFTLVNGFVTFLEMLVLCLFGLIVFMGFGFVVSGIAKTESTIPPMANVVTLPQFLLAGTFFSVDVFPAWLQPICKIMPLTYLNDALRKVAFEGLHLWHLGPQLLVLTIWGVVVYAVAVKVFRWE
ncbi:ABC transporter permease [Chitinophaga deserti]|uniref:ABC transporter permease n=1 Tax=Chitinophaga deserti TaxID=2164099 RepID=UPI000D6CA7C3|nr:ABC transporter permease [Chitinophaga deserti]